MTTASPALSAPRQLGPDLRHLRRGLRRLRRRIRLLLALRFATLAVAVLSSAALSTVVALKLRGVWFPPFLPELALLAGLVLAALLALVWPLPDVLVAASADRRFAWRDRTLTALHLLRTESRTGMDQAAVADALAHLDGARAGEAFPVRSTRATIVAGSCLLLLVIAQLISLPSLLLPPQQREDRALLRREAARIVPVAKRFENESARAGDTQAQDVGRRLQRLAKDLDRGRLSKKEALLKLDEADQELEKTAERLAPTPPKTAAQAAREMQERAARSLAERAQQLALAAAQRGDRKGEEELRKLAEQMRGARSAEQLKQLAQQMDRAAAKSLPRGLPTDLLPNLSLALSQQDWDKVEELLKSLENLPDDLSPEELAQLRKDLEDLAKSLDQSDLEELKKALLEAAKDCKSGDLKLSKEALKEALKQAQAKFGKLRLAGLARQCESGSSGSGSRPGAGPGGGQGHYDPNAPAASLYAPRGTKTSGKPTALSGQVKPGGKMMTTTELGAPQKVSPSRVPYYEVITDYSKAAEEALSKEDVPPGYRKTVRQYFDSLQSKDKKP